jgi:hypothetical protein
MKILPATAVLLIALCGLNAQDAAQYQHRAASLLLNGDYAAACTELDQAVALYKAQQDWKPYFACLTQLTQAYLSDNKLGEAKKTAKQALWQSISILGRDNDEAARAAHQLAQVYTAASRFKDALHFHNMALDIRTALFGAYHPLVADSYSLLASTLQQQEAYGLAEQHLNTALSILQEAYHAKHAETVPVLSQLGQLYLAMKQDQKAKEYCERAVQVLRSARATDPEQLVDALVQLAQLEQGEQQEALFTEALAIINQQENPSGTAAASVLLHSGHQAAANGRMAQASKYSRSAAMASAGIPTAVELHKGALKLSADCAIAQGNHRKAYAIYQRLLKTNHQADFLLNGAEVAQLAAQWTSAQQWAEQAVEHAYGDDMYAAFLIQAKALLERGQLSEAFDLVQQRLLGPAVPSYYRTPACLIAGEAALRQKDYQGAIQRLQKGLEQTSKDEFVQLQLHAKLGFSYTSLALQDRNTIRNLDEAAMHFEKYMHLLKNTAIQPLSYASWQWLQTNSASIYESALHTCYLQHQMSQEEQWLEAAFQYMESYRVLNLSAEEALYHPSTAEQRLRYLGLNTENGAYDKALQDWTANQQASSLQPIAFQIFKEELTQYDMQAVQHFEGTGHLFVLSITPEGCSLRKQRWTKEEQARIQDFARLRTYTDLLQLGERISEWLVPTLAEANAASRILLLPSRSLQRFPFAGLPLSGKLIGETYELYSNVSASTFVAQAQSDNLWPTPDAAIIELDLKEQAVSAGAIALPTKQHDHYDCTALLSEWAQQQGSTLLSPQQWVQSSLESIGMMLLPLTKVDSLWAYASQSPKSIRQLLLPVPHHLEGRPFAANHAFAKWQQQGVKQIVCYPQDCQNPPHYLIQALTSWQSSGDMAKAMLDARQKAIAELGETEEISAHWLQAQLMGIPAGQQNKVATNIPIRLILLTIGLLIVLGWWLKR